MTHVVRALEEDYRHETESYSPPIQAAKPPAAIEHATTNCSAINQGSGLNHMKREHTTNFSLTPSLCRRNCTSPLEKHSNRLHTQTISRHTNNKAMRIVHRCGQKEGHDGFVWIVAHELLKMIVSKRYVSSFLGSIAPQ